MPASQAHLQLVPDDDHELLARLVSGERAAAAVFYDRFAPSVQRTLRRVMGPDPDLADLLQEVFLAALKGVHRVHTAENLGPWLRGIAVNLARQRIRRRQRRRLVGLADPERIERVAAHHNEDATDAARATYAVLDQLSVDLRVPFCLRYIDRCELTEVAELCGVSLATIKRRLQKAERRFVMLGNKDPALVPLIAKHPRWSQL